MQDRFAARVIGPPPASMIYELTDLILDQAAAKFCPFGLRVIATIRKEMNMPGNQSDARPQEVSTDVPPPAPIPVAAGAAVAAIAPAAIDAANKIINMIRDKEIRERVQITMNAIRADVFGAENAFLENYVEALKRRVLTPDQQKELDKDYEECKKKFQEAVDAARDGAEAANDGEEKTANKDFDKAKKLAEDAVDLLKKLNKKKERMIMDNVPPQDQDGGGRRRAEYR